ncbi:unnamed protein product [Pieris brassicae]|uniref:Uncharacterized protein n=1 Tax=Pieris brassicae TaxID=7116 RepID=A0A9P0TFT2_PIEBR|nr:unnamed protein product [Pieris brassicae]
MNRKTLVNINILHLAAFEAVSKLSVRPFDRQSLIDFRVTQLPEEKPPDDDFDPRDHREPKAPIKYWRTTSM